MSSETKITAIDLFCGIGGLSHGFVREGIRVAAGIDIDPSCQFPFEQNNDAEFICSDISDISPTKLLNIYPANSWKVLAGCAPCTPFSRYSQKTPDDRWKTLNHFGRLIIGTKPDVITMENVPQLANHRVFNTFLNLIESLGYFADWNIVDCRYYGVPQKRRRLVLLASRLGDIQIVPKTHYSSRHRTVAQTIGRLEPIAAGETSMRDPIHKARGLSDLNLRRIMHTPAGGGWKDWNEQLRLDCHKRDAGKTFRDVYGRMRWDQPAPTMTTHCTGLGNGRFGHPDQDRAISLREAALLQTFPKDYKFVSDSEVVPVKSLSRHIGNAVPVRLGRIVARSIIRHLSEQKYER